MDHIIRMTLLDTFKRELINEEKGDLTIEKYIRDVGAFFHTMEEGTVVTGFSCCWQLRAGW